MQFSSNRSPDDPKDRSAAADASDSLQSLRDDIASLADSVKRLASEQLGANMEQVQDKAKEKLGDVETAIRKNPTQAALIAAGVGFVIGLFMTR